MYRRISWKVIFLFAWKVQLAAFLLSSLAFVLYQFSGLRSIAIPFLPVATIGTAVAFYVGFKNNSAYDRLWEGRRIWGSITNAGRMWAAMVHDVVGSRQPGEDTAPVKQAMLYRHLAWMNLLRIQLRKAPVFQEGEYVFSAQLKIIRNLYGAPNFQRQVEEEVGPFLDAEERNSLATKVNGAAFLLQQQNEALIHCKNKGWLDSIEHGEMSRIIGELYNQQGAAERIKSFPFPRQYANFSVVFVYIFIALLPFALLHELEKVGTNATWLVIPFTMLIAWVFNVMEQVGDASENPFDNGINDVPMTAICRNVEIEFRELLGEKELPPRKQPVEGILM
ncbi:MAG TPA: bestrophin family ion channel [Chitinophagaceae bacterium]|nr:bestrophin family ion channel [Chitinophagaceae bacterium]